MIHVYIFNVEFLSRKDGWLRTWILWAVILRLISIFFYILRSLLKIASRWAFRIIWNKFSVRLWFDIANLVVWNINIIVLIAVNQGPLVRYHRYLWVVTCLLIWCLWSVYHLLQILVLYSTWQQLYIRKNQIKEHNYKYHSKFMVLTWILMALPQLRPFIHRLEFSFLIRHIHTLLFGIPNMIHHILVLLFLNLLLSTVG